MLSLDLNMKTLPYREEASRRYVLNFSHSAAEDVFTRWFGSLSDQGCHRNHLSVKDEEEGT